MHKEKSERALDFWIAREESSWMRAKARNEEQTRRLGRASKIRSIGTSRASKVER